MVQLFVSCVTAGVLSVNSEALRSRRSAARPLDDFVWSDLTASTASGTQPSQKISRRVLKAAWLAVPFRALAALAKIKNPKAPAVRPRTIGALNAHAAGTRTVTLDARTVAAHVSGSFLVIGTMPIGVVFLKLITHWLCIIVSLFMKVCIDGPPIPGPLTVVGRLLRRDGQRRAKTRLSLEDDHG